MAAKLQFWIFIFRRLLTQLNSFKSREKPSVGDKKDATSDHVTYELYYRPEQAKFSNNAKVAFFVPERTLVKLMYR